MNRTQTSTKSLNEVLLEFAELKARLEDAESTIDAIRTGAVDAIIVSGEDGDQVFTLTGADEPYRLFVERMQEGAITLDASGTILYCNQAFATMVNEPLECVIGTSFNSHLLADEARGQNDLSLLIGGRSEIVLKSGQGRVEALCSAFPVAAGSPSAYAVTVTDMSAQKRHELELTAATAELEGFCFSVSHDMRAPLRSISGSANIVIEDFGGDLPPGASEELQRIAESANNMGRLIDDLLAYSRLSRHQMVRQNVDLSKSALRIIKHSLDCPTTTIWDIEPSLETSGDPGLLDIILQNLLSNACKFSAKSDPPRIQVGRDVTSGAFFVKDNGVGFDMAYSAKLFLPFERLHAQEEFAGTGIGLANVKRIVAQHGGTVWAESKEGSGSTFYFTLGSGE